MNKWWVRFWGLVALASLAALLASTTQGKEAGAVRAPDERRIAKVILREGLTGPGIQSLLDLRGLQLVSVEAKVPVPATGTTMTVFLGHAHLAAFPGTFGDRVDAALDFEREKFRVKAQRLEGQPGARQQMLEFREVAESPQLAVHSLEVLGRREDLQPLLADRRVRQVIVDEDESRIAAIDAAPLDGIVRGPGGGMPSIMQGRLAIPTGRLITDRPVTPNPELALSALHAFFRTSDDAFISKTTVREHARVEKASMQAPEERRAADVLLRRGFNARDVGRLLGRHQLTYMSCEAKSPTSQQTTMTMMTFPGGPIPWLPGTIAEQVERDLIRHRLTFEEHAQYAPDTAQAAYYREVARSPEMGVYRVEVVGTYRDLAALIREPEVRGVYAESDGLRARAFDEKRAQDLKNMRVIRTRRVLDPNSPMPPQLEPPPLPP